MAYSPYSVGSNSTSPPSQTSPLPYVKTEQHPRHGVHAGPRLVIVEQPQERFRFRYESELGGTHGQLAGRSGAERRSFPTVKLEGFHGKANIKCELYTVSDSGKPPVPHVHTLQGRYCANGVADFSIDHSNDYTASFQGLGIIHTAKKAMLEKIKARKLMEKNTGPHWKPTEAEERQATQEANSESLEINMNRVCLRFRALVQDPASYRMRDICEPVYSDPIFNGKSAQTGELKIVQLSDAYSPCTGNKEIWLLVERVRKNDIKVRFFEEDETKQEIWHAYGKVSKCHHQYAIIFQTPAYHNKDLRGSVRVFIQLERPSDGCVSEAKHFQYTERDQRATKRLGIQAEATDQKRCRTVEEPTGEPYALSGRDRFQDGRQRESPPPRWGRGDEMIGQPQVAAPSAEYLGRGQHQFHSAQAAAEWERARMREMLEARASRGEERDPGSWMALRGSHLVEEPSGGGASSSATGYGGAIPAVRPPVDERYGGAIPAARAPIEERYGGADAAGSSDSIHYVERDSERQRWERGKARDEPKTRGWSGAATGALRAPLMMPPSSVLTQRPLLMSAHPRPPPLPPPSDPDTAIDLSVSSTSSEFSGSKSAAPRGGSWSRPVEPTIPGHPYPGSGASTLPSSLATSYVHSNIPTVVNQVSAGRILHEPARWRGDNAERVSSRSRAVESPRMGALISPADERQREAARREREAISCSLPAGPRTIRRTAEAAPAAVADGAAASPRRPDRADAHLERPPETLAESRDRGLISVRKELGVMASAHKTRSAPPDLIRIAPDPGRICPDSVRARLEAARMASECLPPAGPPPAVVRPRSLPMHPALSPQTAAAAAERERILAGEALLKLHGEAGPRRTVECGVEGRLGEATLAGDTRASPPTDHLLRVVSAAAGQASVRAEAGRRLHQFSRSRSVTEKPTQSAPEVQNLAAAGQLMPQPFQTQRSAVVTSEDRGRAGTPPVLMPESPGRGTSGQSACTSAAAESTQRDQAKAADDEARHLQNAVSSAGASPAPAETSSADGAESDRLTPSVGGTGPTQSNSRERRASGSRRTASERSSVEEDRLVIDDPDGSDDLDAAGRAPAEPPSCQPSSAAPANGVAAQPSRNAASLILSMPSLVTQVDTPLVKTVASTPVRSVSMVTPVVTSVPPGTQVVDYVNTSAGQVKISIDMSQLPAGSAGSPLTSLKTSSPPQPGAV